MDRLPADLWACQQLTRLELDLKGSAPLPAAPAAPAPLPALRELRLVGCRLPGGVLPLSVCHLAGLRRLEVQRCGLTSGCIQHGLPHQISQLAQLVRARMASSVKRPAALHAPCSLHPGPLAHSGGWSSAAPSSCLLPPAPPRRRT